MNDDTLKDTTQASTPSAEARLAPLDRWAVERAIKASDLAPPSRLLMHTLLTHVSNGTLVIPAKYAPSLTALTKETGLSRSTVADHLNILERDGWIDRARPATKEALSEKARTAYRIQVPAGLLSDAPFEPVREADQSGRRTSPGGGPVEQEGLFGTGPGAGLVREADTTSPGAGLNPMCSPTSSSPTEKKEGGAGGRRARPKSEEHPRFAEWYALYPLRKERAAAAAAFNKAAAKVDDIEVLFAAAKDYRENDPYVLRGYIKNPATWLNKGCWLDEIAPAPQPPEGAQVHHLRPAGAGGRPSAGFAAGSGALAYVQTAEEIDNAEVNL